MSSFVVAAPGWRAQTDCAAGSDYLGNRCAISMIQHVVGWLDHGDGHIEAMVIDGAKIVPFVTTKDLAVELLAPGDEPVPEEAMLFRLRSKAGNLAHRAARAAGFEWRSQVPKELRNKIRREAWEIMSMEGSTAESVAVLGQYIGELLLEARATV